MRTTIGTGASASRGNLALTRDALLAIIPFDANQPLSSWFEIYQRTPAKAIQFILHTAPVQ